MRWDTVWAVLYQYVLFYMLRSANWLTAVVLLLFKH
jgi:ABC-type iron transport system FetAB permease component